MMTITIKELTFDVIIGLLDFERDKTQRVIINLEASYLYEEKQFINYADIASKIEKKLKVERYLLLEEALLGIEKILHQDYPQITTLFVEIAKPDILDNCIVSLKKSWSYR